MGRVILFSPVGGTDPISDYNGRDGSLLHICRYYKPDEVIMYLSAEMLEKHNTDNRYIYCLDRLAELNGHKMEYKFIERPELKDVQEFDYFYNDFRDIIADIYSRMDRDDELLLNVSSGTPAMKSALLVINIMGEFPFKAIQVSTPEKGMNKVMHGDNYDCISLWEKDEDNFNNESRCSEVRCPSLSMIKNEQIIKKQISSYDYRAACDVADSISDEFSSRYKSLLLQANARLRLEFEEADRLAEITGYDCTPIKDINSRKYFEYALNLDIKLKRGEYADFIRGITPLILDLFELILRNNIGIDIDDFSEIDQNGIRKWSENKLFGTEIETLLDQCYKGRFNRNSPIYSDPLIYLIKTYSTDKKMKYSLDSLRKAERAVRNVAAHEIVSITDEKVKELSGFTGKQIMGFIKELFQYANIGIEKDMWSSYEKMNDYIIAVMDRRS